MVVEVINTGTELLLGDILNTNFQDLSKELNEKGFNVLYQTTVGDNEERILEVLDIALKRADIVITTGGLGPTRGDITAEMVAKYLNIPLELDQLSLDKIKEFFAKKEITMTSNNIKQAMVPKGAHILKNIRGTAPGMVVKTLEGKLIILLPGPPSEMKSVSSLEMIPYLEKNCKQQGIIHSKVLHLRNRSESSVAAQLDDIIMGQTNPTIALYARKGEIVIRITAKSTTLTEAELLISAMEQIVRERLNKFIFGVDDETLASALGKLLKKGKYTIAFAESCTGGLASSMLTDIPGSSNYLLGSVVSYSNMAKNKVINVKQETLDEYGAVSQQVACQMAEGVRSLFGTNIGVGITGIAGPEGGSDLKPLGLVYISVTNEKGTVWEKNIFHGSRSDNKLRSVMSAFSLVIDKLNEL